jgi:hypothetical protein
VTTAGSGQRDDLRSRVSPKIRLQTRLFFLIAAGMLVTLIVRVAQGEISVPWALASLVAGGVIGRLAGRSSLLSWDTDTSTIVSRMDLLGGIILLLYLGFVFGKGRIVGHWIHDAHLVAAIGFGLTAGAMITRVAGTVSQIRELFRQAGFIAQE